MLRIIYLNGADLGVCEASEKKGLHASIFGNNLRS